MSLALLQRLLRRTSLVLLIILCCACFLPCFASSNGSSDLEISSSGVSKDVSDLPSSGSSDQAIQEVKIDSLRISASDTSGFHAVILGLLGDYNPIVKDYTYQSTQGYTSHSIDIQPDWSWICSAAIFLVIIFCLFRLIGGIFSWKR